jgi:methyl-accepting chemotaxis protein
MTNILQSKNLKTRILLGYSVPIGVIALFAMVMGGSLNYLSYEASDLARANKVVDNVRETVIHTSRIVRSLRGAALFPKDQQYRDSFQTGHDRLDDVINEFGDGELIHDPQQKANWKKLMANVKTITDDADNAMAEIKAGQVAQAIAEIGQIEMGAFDKVKDDMLTRQDDILGEIQGRVNWAIGLTIAVIILGLFGGSGISLVLGNMIAGAIAKDVKMAVAEVSAASNEIAATMEQQERTASLQAASVSETTTTMDELGASSQQSQEQAEAAAQAAQEVLALAGRGNDSVEETVASMIDLKNKVAAIADQIVRLSEQTNQIGNISQLVGDLSQQTNMLALNASVEAVRAGEHGKGFAVVAEEIRKLADQSRQSADKIGGLVSDIQNAINTTVMVTDEGTKTVNAGMNVTEQTANAFAGVLESINNVAMNNQQIALNIRQQGKAVQQVLDAMSSINKGAQENAAGLSQIKTGTQQLNESAKSLEAIL